MSGLIEQLKSYGGLGSRAEALRSRQDSFSRKELDRLLELARRLNACQSEEEALRVILLEAVHLTDADHGFLAVGDSVQYRVNQGIDKDGYALNRPSELVSHSIIQRVLKSGLSLRSSNLSEMDELAFSKSVIDLDLKSSLCVPMRRGGLVIGALCVDSTSTRIFSEHMLVLLDGFCELGSMTLAQLHLRHEELVQQEKLAQLEETHRMITDNLPNALVLFDEAGRILFANRKFQSDYTDTTIIQRDEAAPFGLAFRSDFKDELMRTAFNGGSSMDCESERLVLRAWPFALELRNKERQWGAVIADITTEHKMQLDLLEREKLSMVSRMSGSIAHEIRNALAPLVGHAELAKMRLQQPVCDIKELGRDLEKMDEMADRIARIAESLRDLSRPMEHKPRVTNLNALIRKTLNLMQETGGRIKFFQLVDEKAQTGVEVKPDTFRILMDLDEEVQDLKLDTEMIQQALINLVVNAADALGQKQGGRIHCRTRQREESIEVIVEDNGCGMDESTLSQIWEPYYSTKGDNGTGLGMPMIRMVLESHGGQINIESKVGYGTRLTLSFPTAE